MTGGEAARAAGPQTSSTSDQPGRGTGALGADSAGAGHGHASWPSSRLVALWFACFAAYAGLLALFAGGEDGTWGTWGFGTYTVVALLLRFRTDAAPGGRSPAASRLRAAWWPALTVAVLGSLVAPFAWLVGTGSADPAEVTVMTHGAAYLIHHGTPYLPVGQLTAWTDYNPYLPLMDLFGLPAVAGLPKAIADPRVYTSLVTIALLATSFALRAKGSIRTCPDCRSRAARMTAIAVASPVIGFPLVLGITDPPVIAMTILALACLSRGWLLRTALAVAAACALKYTAWPEVPVLAVMVWARYSPWQAVRFTGVTLATAVALALAAAPNALSDPGSIAANTLDYPLGLTKIKTVAASPLPGHLIASIGPTGKAIAVVILLAAALAFAIWLVRRPPTTYQAVTVRLAVAYALMFTLAPATRYGYYIYPLALLFWLPLASNTPFTKRLRQTPLPLRALLHRRSSTA